MRSSTARSTRSESGTGTRSRPATRSRNSCSGSGMGSGLMTITQQFAETGTGPLHTHLERRFPRPNQLDHLIVAQLFHVLEQKRLALFRHQGRKRLVNLVLRSPPTQGVPPPAPVRRIQRDVPCRIASAPDR